jgi:hypothetical protein
VENPSELSEDDSDEEIYWTISYGNSGSDKLVIENNESDDDLGEGFYYTITHENNDLDELEEDDASDSGEEFYYKVNYEHGDLVNDIEHHEDQSQSQKEQEKSKVFTFSDLWYEDDSATVNGEDEQETDDRYYQSEHVTKPVITMESENQCQGVVTESDEESVLLCHNASKWSSHVKNSGELVESRNTSAGDFNISLMGQMRSAWKRRKKKNSRIIDSEQKKSQARTAWKLRRMKRPKIYSDGYRNGKRNQDTLMKSSQQIRTIKLTGRPFKVKCCLTGQQMQALLGRGKTSEHMS